MIRRLDRPNRRRRRSHRLRRLPPLAPGPAPRLQGVRRAVRTAASSSALSGRARAAVACTTDALKPVTASVLSLSVPAEPFGPAAPALPSPPPPFVVPTAQLHAPFGGCPLPASPVPPLVPTLPSSPCPISASPPLPPTDEAIHRRTRPGDRSRRQPLRDRRRPLHHAAVPLFPFVPVAVLFAGALAPASPAAACRRRRSRRVRRQASRHVRRARSRCRPASSRAARRFSTNRGSRCRRRRCRWPACLVVTRDRGDGVRCSERPHRAIEPAEEGNRRWKIDRPSERVATADVDRLRAGETAHRVFDRAERCGLRSRSARRSELHEHAARGSDRHSFRRDARRRNPRRRRRGAVRARARSGRRRCRGRRSAGARRAAGRRPHRRPAVAASKDESADHGQPNVSYCAVRSPHKTSVKFVNSCLCVTHHDEHINYVTEQMRIAQAAPFRAITLRLAGNAPRGWCRSRGGQPGQARDETCCSIDGSVALSLERVAMMRSAKPAPAVTSRAAAMASPNRASRV